MIKPRAKQWRQRFVLIFTVVVTWQLSSVALVDSLPVWEAPETLFVLVVVGAGCCVVAAAAVLWLAFENELPELAMIASFMYCVSFLPLAHGIATPGVLYGANSTSGAAVLWAIPLGLVAAASAMLRTTPGLGFAVRNWRPWSLFFVGVASAAGIALLVFPNTLPDPASHTTATYGIALASFVGAVALAWRQLDLAIIGDSPGSFAAAGGLMFIGGSTFVWLGEAPYTVLFWSTHVLDITGVLGLAAGTAYAYRQGATMRSIIKPLTVRDPLSALELGLDPLVHRFVADLEAKDQMTRDHVVRTAELAVHVAERMKLAPEYVRAIGIGALLHDVGKLDVPERILKKPSGLSDDEYEIIKQHPIWGERLVSESPVLAATALIVRGHHERVDGTGYPDGLSGAEIPLGARIVAVCDAFDAMIQSRHYRTGMEREQVLDILRTHRGSQWDSDVVDVVLSMVDELDTTGEPMALDAVGRRGAIPSTVGAHDAFCGCADALPSADELAEPFAA